MTREDYGSTDTLAWRPCLAECLKARKDGKRSRTASLRLSKVFYSVALNSLIPVCTKYFCSWLCLQEQ